MKEIPILYSTPMVQAKLAGRKTQTRRTTGLAHINQNPNDWEIWGSNSGETGFFTVKEGYFLQLRKKSTGQTMHLKVPYKPGDVLWGRETIGYEPYFNGLHMNSYLRYKADIGDNPVDWRWTPSIHMPKIAARIWERVKSVRVERLQDISENDAIAEGFAKISKDNRRTWKYGIPDTDGLPGSDDFGWKWSDWNVDPREAYMHLWDLINGKDSHKLNPWVWVIETEVLSTTGRPKDL